MWQLPEVSGEGYGNARWITPGPMLVEQWRPKGPGLHVGVHWNGSLENGHDSGRSIPVDLLRPLFDLPVTFHSLQTGPMARQCPHNVIDHSNEIKTFVDTAALIAGLDLVIAVDSSPANLTGALGKTIWALVESPCDFRWAGDGDSTPWFPSARVFRQDRRGDWKPVIQKMRHELEALARAGRNL
jgi:hypothetical protein